MLPVGQHAAFPEMAADADQVTRGVLLVRTAAGRLAQPDLTLPPARLEQLTHTILSHHGRREWRTLLEPHTAEALLVHLADYAESRLWHYANEEHP